MAWTASTLGNGAKAFSGFKWEISGLGLATGGEIERKSTMITWFQALQLIGCLDKGWRDSFFFF